MVIVLGLMYVRFGMLILLKATLRREKRKKRKESESSAKTLHLFSPRRTSPLAQDGRHLMEDGAYTVSGSISICPLGGERSTLSADEIEILTPPERIRSCTYTEQKPGSGASCLPLLWSKVSCRRVVAATHRVSAALSHLVGGKDMHAFRPL